MNNPNNNPQEGLFSHTDDYYKLIALAEKYPSIQEIKIKDKKHYKTLIEITKEDADIIPLFIKNSTKNLRIISSYSREIEQIQEDSYLAYIGKPFDIEEV